MGIAIGVAILMVMLFRGRMRKICRTAQTITLIVLVGCVSMSSCTKSEAQEVTGDNWRQLLNNGEAHAIPVQAAQNSNDYLTGCRPMFDHPVPMSVCHEANMRDLKQGINDYAPAAQVQQINITITPAQPAWEPSFERYSGPYNE